MTGDLLGAASFPWEFQSSPNLDGVVVRFDVFGSNVDMEGPWRLGRTTTHELGHWLGLYHIFQGGCKGDGDGISDTPAQNASYVTLCPTTAQTSCGSSDMYMNYMSYANDACRNMFSTGQSQVMRSVFNTGEDRAYFNYTDVQISSPTDVCIGNSTFTLQNLPYTATITWINSATLTYVSGQGTNSYTVSPSSPFIKATGWVEVSIDNNCSFSLIRKNIWVGKPGTVNTTPYGAPAVEMSIGQVLTISAIGPNDTPGSDIYSLNWNKTGNSIGVLSNGPGNYVVEALYPGTDYAYVSANNNCGTGISHYIPINVTSGGGGGIQQQLIASPNPADNEVNINLTGVFANKKNTSVEAYLYNNVNEVVFYKQIHESELVITTNNLAEGLYHLKVITEKKEFQRHIIIKH